MSRIIFHIDVNSAFLSWSAVKLVQDGGQDLRLIPSVVSGDPNDRRSIVTAASIPAKKLGVKVATPVSMALRTCPGLVLVRGDWEWYKRCSEGFIAISDFEKPDKVHTLWDSEVQQKMWPLGVRDLIWVGKKTEERLLAYGINTIGDLARLSLPRLTRVVGQKFAVQLHESANGRNDSPVETEIPEAKSYSAERTFPKDLVDPKDIDRALFHVACIVAHRIRRDHFRASTVSMFIKYKDFSVAQKQCQVPQPTDITAVILNEARRMLAEVWDGITPLRQVGLGVSKLTHESFEQMSLFEDPKMEYYREWDRQYDAGHSKDRSKKD